MSSVPNLHQPSANSDEREKARALRVFNIFDSIAKRLGAPTPMISQMTALAALAENKALWLLLKDKGFVTEAEVQTYLDRGVDELCAQTDRRLGRLMVDSYG